MIKKILLTSTLLFAICIAFSQNKVKVLSYELSLAKDMCKEWYYPKKDSLGIILSKMTALSGPMHHCCYNNWSCSIEGKVLYNGKEYNYSLNAGGWVRLVSLDYKEQFMLACTKKEYFKYFISVYDNS